MWKILVVDDNSINRKLLIDMLKDYAQCDSASSGKEALEIYGEFDVSSRKYDIILLDISMPDMDGIEFLQILRSKEKSFRIKKEDGVSVIIVTAYKDTFLEAFENGCNDFILKPVKEDELIEKINLQLIH